MRTITIWLMIFNLERARVKLEKETNSIFRSAYKLMIKNYENTIMYLKEERK